MLLGKLVGTTSAFAAGAPGGALTPTMVAAAGSALLVVAGLDRLGVTSVDPSAVVVMAAAVAIAIGLHAPLTAVVVVPEMMGQLALVPATTAVVLAAVVLERMFDRLVFRLQPPAPSVIQDEDG
jgi:H+/Cl- antiporter ClcA